MQPYKIVQTTRSELAVTPTKALKVLLLEKHYSEGLAAWVVLLLPIALLWIIGGIVLGTVRWLVRSFRARKA
jgi:hypothetical protein